MLGARGVFLNFNPCIKCLPVLLKAGLHAQCFFAFSTDTTSSWAYRIYRLIFQMSLYGNEHIIKIDLVN